MMNKDASKDLEVAKPRELTMVDSDYGDSGLENVDASDRIIPRLQIASGNCKQLKRGSDKYMPELRDGDIFDTVSEQIYGEEILVIPVYFAKERILFDQNFKIECRSVNAVDGGTVSPTCAECEYSKWGSGKDGVGTACLEFRNFAVMILDKDGALLGPVKIGMKSASSGAAKKWLNMIGARKIRTPEGRMVTPKMYTGVYKLRAAMQPGKKADFYTFAVSNAGDTPAVHLPEVRNIHNQFKAAALKLSADSEMETAAGHE